MQIVSMLYMNTLDYKQVTLYNTRPKKEKEKAKRKKNI